MTTDLLIGEVLDGKYRIDAPLGSGGMGTVYRGMHVGTGREVALKVLVAKLTSNEAAVERFKREARTAGQMRHPNVVDVTDFGFAERGGERVAYLVMELLHGKTLRAVLEAEGRLPIDVAVDVLDQVCAAVEEAHKLGVLHRDLKPENIHLGPPVRGRYRVKVLDFGIAKLLSAGPETNPVPAAPAPLVVPGDAVARDFPQLELGTSTTMPVGEGEGSLTRLGAAIGTPRYMSPEQWVGRALDGRSDIYSLGVVAYEMLAGRPPFTGTGGLIAIEHAQLAPPPLAEKAPTVPKRIAGVIEAALAKEPEQRPPSAAAFAAGLKAGSETTGKLLRRSIALCADHYALFSRRCVLLTVPPVALSAIGVASGVLARHGLVSERGNYAVGMGASALAGLVGFLFWAPAGGLIVPLVADLLASRTPSRSPWSVAELLRLARAAVPSTIALLAGLAILILAPLLLTRASLELGPRNALVDAFLIAPAASVVLCAVVAPLAVYPAVIAVEGARGLAPLRRSVALLRPMWRAAFGVSLLYAILGILPSGLIRVVMSDDVGARSAGATSDLTARTSFLLIWLVNAVLTPFILVPPAMLYLRAREAEGSPLP